VLDSQLAKILAQVLAVAMIMGVVRLVRRGIGHDYAAFAFVSAGMLLIWHFPPNERFTLPMFPLLAAGLVTELEHLWNMTRAAFKHKDQGQRVVARGFATVVAFLLIGGLALQVYVAIVFMPIAAEQQRDRLRDQRAAYKWIRQNVPSTSMVMACLDPLLYLETGRKSISLPLPPRYWYAEDHNAMVETYRDIATFARRHGMQYFYFMPDDLARDTGNADLKKLEEAVRSNPDLETVFQAGTGTIYKVR
jgi:hypothetical protein